MLVRRRIGHAWAFFGMAPISLNAAALPLPSTKWDDVQQNNYPVMRGLFVGPTWNLARRGRKLDTTADMTSARERWDLQSPVRLEATGDPAFATNPKGRIVASNKAFEKLLGYSADSVVGKDCWEVLRGRDVFGNLYCHECCSAHQSLSRNEPVCSFEFDVRSASGSFVRVVCSTVLVNGEGSAKSTVVHLLRATTRGTAGKDDGENSCAEASQAGKVVAHDRGKRSELTERQSEILRRLADGWTSRSVAEELGISVATVRTHISHILRAFAVHNLRQAIAAARRRDLI